MNFVVTEPKTLKTEGPKDLELAEPNESKFRISLRKGKLILTYKSHLPKEDYCAWLLQKGKSLRAWVAHENADENNPYEHSHVLIMYEENFETRNARYFDYNAIHPNIKKIVTKKHLLNVFKYMCKEDKSLEQTMQLLAQQHGMTLFERVSQCETIQDVMNMAETPGDALGLAKMFELKTQRPIRVLPPHYQWQKDLDDELKENPDDRRIVWYYDDIGKSGKTKFAKYQAVTYPKDVYIVSQFGGPTNAASIVKSALDSGWSGQAMIVNLTRSAEAKAIYEPLEMVKDGLITATKYQGSTLVFNEPHVIVFANFLPDVFAMSLDRWEIRILTKINGNPRVARVLSGEDTLKLLEQMEEDENDTSLSDAINGLDMSAYAASSSEGDKWK